MDKRREELEEQKAELHLALLMDEYAERMGKQAREEAEAAFANGELQMPEELDAACRKLIADAPVPGSPKKPARKLARYALVAAAAVMLLFGTLVAVQAAGIDVFGSIAMWTDSVFRFGKNTEDELIQSSDQRDELQDALREYEMPIQLAPAGIYAYTNVCVEQSQNEYLKSVIVSAEGEQGNSVQIIIEENTAFEAGGNTVWEKTAQSPDSYTSNGRTFYVFHNESGYSGVWSDGRYTVSLFGFETMDELTSIIDTMEEIL